MNDDLVVADIRRHLRGIPIASLDVFATIDSTNTYLMAAAEPPNDSINVAVAAHQTAGRGSHNRTWLSSPDGSLCMSVAYRFSRKPSNLPSLTLAVGMAICAALRSTGAKNTGVKWPNDIVDDHGKLAGILTETRQRGNAPPTVVIGVGINVALSESVRMAAARNAHAPVSDLQNSALSLTSRSELAGLIVRAMYAALIEFDRSGFAIAYASWEQYDRLSGQKVQVEMPESDNIQGVCDGITADGALLVMTAKGQRVVTSGSVRVTNSKRVAS